MVLVSTGRIRQDRRIQESPCRNIVAWDEGLGDNTGHVLSNGVSRSTINPLHADINGLTV